MGNFSTLLDLIDEKREIKGDANFHNTFYALNKGDQVVLSQPRGDTRNLVMYDRKRKNWIKTDDWEIESDGLLSLRRMVYEVTDKKRRVDGDYREIRYFLKRVD